MTKHLTLAFAVFAFTACKKGKEDKPAPAPAEQTASAPAAAAKPTAAPPAACPGGFTKPDGAPVCIKLGADATAQPARDVGTSKVYAFNVKGGTIEIMVDPGSISTVDERLGQVSTEMVTGQGEIPNGKWIVYKEPSGKTPIKSAIKTKDGLVQCDGWPDSDADAPAIYESCKTLVVQAMK